MLFDVFVLVTNCDINLQGDPSGCSLGFVDIKAKVAFLYEEHILY